MNCDNCIYKIEHQKQKEKDDENRGTLKIIQNSMKVVEQIITKRRFGGAK